MAGEQTASSAVPAAPDHLLHEVVPTAPADRVPVPKRIAYGMGNFADHIGTDTLLSNANPIFNVALHMDPRLLGLGLGICRLFDGITDPIAGALSDNTRSKWGRRRPFMLVGAIGCGLTLPLIWMVPQGVTGFGLFLWFTIFSVIFVTFQTCFTIPWTALGYELTPDYNERTRVMEWRAYLGTAVGIFAPWTYAITQLPIWGGNTLLGAQWMGAGVGVLIIIAGLIPVFFLSERFFKKAQRQEKISILKSILLTLKNRPFLMMVGITFFTVVGGRTVNFLGFYIALYYLFQGDTAKQAIFGGITGNVALVIGLASVFLLNLLSQRLGKRHTLGLCLVLLIFSSLVKWFCYIPEHPYLSMVVFLFTTPAMSGFWLLIASIKADICDEDELVTGLRREGAIGSISAWISKVSASATTVLAGFVIAATGYHAASGAAQSPETIYHMRLWYSFIPSATAIIALALLIYFPISERRARETRRLLEERRGKL